MGKGSSGTTTTTQSGPPPQVLANYQAAVNRAQTASNQPYQPYPGNIVAPFSDMQEAAFGNAGAPSAAFYGAAPEATFAYGNAGTAFDNAGTAFGGAGTAFGNAGTAFGSAGTAFNTAGTAYGNYGTALGAAAGAYGNAGEALQGAAGEYGASTTPIYQTVGNYLSPYTQDVVNATARQFANTNAIQNAGIVGNAVSQNAWGGDRSAIAQAITAGQQQQAEAPVLAGLYNTGYQTALGANEAQNWLYSQAGSGLAGLGSGFNSIGAGFGNIGAGFGNIGAGFNNIGTGYTNIGSGFNATGSGLNATGSGFNNTGTGYTNLGNGITGFGTAGANVGTSQLNTYQTLGAQEQAQNQAGLNVPYQQYIAGQAYPFQTSQFFTNAATGIGSLAGGQSSTTAPGPSPISQVGGLLSGAAGIAGLFLAKGGRVDPAHGVMPVSRDVEARPMAIGIRGTPHKLRMSEGGIIGRRQGERHFADAGVISPFLPNVKIPDESVSWVPTDKSSLGPGPPHPPAVNPTPQQGIGQSIGGIDFSKLGDLVKKIKGSGSGVTMTESGFDPAALGANTAFNNAAASGLYNDPAEITSSDTVPTFFPDSGDFARGGIVGLRHYDDGGGLDDPYKDVSITTAPAISDTDVGKPFINATPGIAPTLQGLSPAVQKFVPRESGGKPFVGYTSPETFARTGKFTDLRDAPVDETGAPIWSGDMGPNGISTAFGPAQITRTTWTPIAKELGVTDWRAPGAYAAVANELHRREGDVPWAASAPSHGIAPRVQVAQANTGSDATVSVTSPAAPSAPASQTPEPKKMTGWEKLQAQGVNPWLALAIAGFSTAAGRSPFAMQNIGAGFAEGAKYLATGPELALKQAQARKEGALATQAEAQTGLLQSQIEYARNHQGDLVGGLDNHINAVAAEIKNGTPAPSVPGSAAPSVEPGTQLSPPSDPVPSPASAPSVPGTASAPPVAPSLPPVAVVAGQNVPAPTPASSQDPRLAQLDSLYRQIENAVKYVNGMPALPQDKAKQIAQYTEQLVRLRESDPRWAALKGQMTVEAENPGLISRAAGEAAAKLRFTPGTARPGSYTTMGGVPTGAVPEWKTAVDPNSGRTYGYWATPPLPGQMPPQNAQGPGPAGNAGVVTQIGPGEHTTLVAQANHEQDQRQKVINQAGDAQMMQSTLGNMNRDADKFYRGPLAPEVNEARSYLRLFDASQTEPVASYEDFIKNSGLVTRTAVREVSSRAALQEYNLISKSLPHPSMSPQGLRQVTNELMGVNDYRIIKAQAQKQWEDEHNGQVHGFETAFQANVTPTVFIMRRMDPTLRENTIAELQKTNEGKALIGKLRAEAQYLQASGLSGAIE